MKIPSNSLEAFLAVARHGQFTKAAHHLGLTQSALSQRILNLESQLETTLFVRDRAGPRLTPEGEELLRYAQSQEAMEDEFLARRQGAAGPGQGTVRVAGFSSVTRSLLLPALAGFLHGRDCRLSLFSRELAELPELLQRGEADLILLDREWDRAGIASSFLGFEENVWVRARRAKTPPDWFLDHDPDDPTTIRYFQKFGPKGMRPPRRFLDDVYGLIEGVRLGLGQAILPRHLVEHERELEIVQPERVLRVPVWLHYPRQSFYPRLLLEARAAVEAHLRAALPQK